MSPCGSEKVPVFLRSFFSGLSPTDYTAFCSAQCLLDLGKVLQRQGFRADAGIKACGFDGSNDLLLGQVQPTCNGIGSSLAALPKGGAHQRKVAHLPGAAVNISLEVA